MALFVSSGCTGSARKYETVSPYFYGIISLIGVTQAVLVWGINKKTYSSTGASIAQSGCLLEVFNAYFPVILPIQAILSWYFENENEMKCQCFRPLFLHYEGWIGRGTAWANEVKFDGFFFKAVRLNPIFWMILIGGKCWSIGFKFF